MRYITEMEHIPRVRVPYEVLNQLKIKTMKVNKEVEIDFDELNLWEVFEELRGNIDAAGWLFNDEYKAKIIPHKAYMLEKLNEIENFLNNPHDCVS